MKKIAIGDKVAYSEGCLRATGQYIGDVPAARGVVTDPIEVGSTTLAQIPWGDKDSPAG